VGPHEKTFFPKIFIEKKIRVLLLFGHLIRLPCNLKLGVCILLHVLCKCLSCAHAIEQAVSYQLPAAEAQIQASARSYGICGGQNGAGASGSIPLPLLIPPIAPFSSFTIWGS
jgi:hypothetical protein